jgi:hypothetical protein
MIAIRPKAFSQAKIGKEIHIPEQARANTRHPLAIDKFVFQSIEGRTQTVYLRRVTECVSRKRRLKVGYMHTFSSPHFSQYTVRNASLQLGNPGSNIRSCMPESLQGDTVTGGSRIESQRG